MAVDWGYYNNENYNAIIDEYLSFRGEGETIATQIVTATCKLIYKWYNDGDVFDNTKYLEGWWNDLSSYANWLYTHSVYGGILDKVFECETGGEYEDLLKEFYDKVFDKELLACLNNKPKDGSIYECKGKFKYIETY